MLAGLLRNGRGVLSSGRGLLASLFCRERCCGNTIFYCKFDRCFGDPTLSHCRVEPPGPEVPSSIYVVESLVNSLLCGPPFFVILYQGYCYIGPNCGFYDPDESPASTTGAPIPVGSVVVRADQAGDIECADNCLDPRCNVVRWMIGVPCGCGPQPKHPVYICAGNFVGCFVKSVDGVCLRFDSGATTTNPIASGTFLGAAAAFGALTCCECCGGACQQVPFPGSTDCTPWRGGSECCCDDADLCCLATWDYKDQYFHCGVGPALIHTWLTPGCANRSAGLIPTVRHRVRTGLFLEAETTEATAVPTYCIPELFDPYIDGCVGTFRTELDGTAYIITTTSMRRNCTRYEKTVVKEQFQDLRGEGPGCPVSPSVSLRRRETFKYVYTRSSNGPCSGGCESTTQVGQLAARGGAATGGCAGCEEGQRRRIA